MCLAISAWGLDTVVASEYYVVFDVDHLLSRLLGGPFQE